MTCMDMCWERRIGNGAESREQRAEVAWVRGEVDEIKAGLRVELRRVPQGLMQEEV